MMRILPINFKKQNLCALRKSEGLDIRTRKNLPLDFSKYSSAKHKDSKIQDVYLPLFKGKSAIPEKHYAFTKDELIEILEETKDLTLESGSLLKERYNEQLLYDFPLCFVTACYNSRDLGDGYIYYKTPKIFNGIDKKELFSAFDTLSFDIISDLNEIGSVKEIKIAGKSFYLKLLTRRHAECCAYLVSDKPDDDVNSVVYKVYRSLESNNNVITVGPVGYYGNIGILREANMAGVVDVPELYFANPIISKIRNIDSYTGAWVVVENANHKKIENGLKLLDWLDKMELDLWDNKRDNIVKGVYVDLGYILPKSYGFCGCLGDESTNEIYARYLQGETTQDIIDYLKTIK